MPSITATFDDNGLAARLHAAGPKAIELANLAIRKTALDVTSDAKALAPVDTGLLRSSIHPTMTGGGATPSADVTAGALYAKYVEHGTSRMTARPFLRPAHDRRGPLLQKVGEQIGKAALG